VSASPSNGCCRAQPGGLTSALSKGQDGSRKQALVVPGPSTHENSSEAMFFSTLLEFIRSSGTSGCITPQR
jgi:hypothetical protein